MPEQATPAGADPAVHQPTHYTRTKRLYGFEVIEVTEHLGFNLGNAIKYLLRAGIKDPSTYVQDIEKALWYLDRTLATGDLGVSLWSLRSALSTTIRAARDLVEDPLKTLPEAYALDATVLRFLDHALIKGGVTPEVLEDLVHRLRGEVEWVRSMATNPTHQRALPLVYRSERDVITESDNPKEWAEHFLHSFKDRLQTVDLEAVLTHWFGAAMDRGARTAKETKHV